MLLKDDDGEWGVVGLTPSYSLRVTTSQLAEPL
jgi:hypothetical protein